MADELPPVAVSSKRVTTTVRRIEKHLREISDSLMFAADELESRDLAPQEDIDLMRERARLALSVLEDRVDDGE